MRLINALYRGGRAYRDDVGYIVYRSSDRRRAALGRLCQDRIEALQCGGHLGVDRDGPDGAHCLKWMGPRLETPTPLPVGEGIVRPLMAERRRTYYGSLLSKLTRPGTAVRERRLAAAKRFLQDVEQAGASASVTMRWDRLAAPSRSSVTPSRPGGGRYTEASRNLAHIAAYLGASRSALLYLVVIHECSRAHLARRLSLSAREAGACAADLLDDLANAYDLTVPAR